MNENDYKYIERLALRISNLESQIGVIRNATGNIVNRSNVDTELARIYSALHKIEALFSPVESCPENDLPNNRDCQHINPKTQPR